MNKLKQEQAAIGQRRISTTFFPQACACLVIKYDCRPRVTPPPSSLTAKSQTLTTSPSLLRRQSNKHRSRPHSLAYTNARTKDSPIIISPAATSTTIKMRFALAAFGLAAVASASMSYDDKPDTPVAPYSPPANTTVPPKFTTKVVTSYTTYCPTPTEIVHGEITYTVTEATTLSEFQRQTDDGLSSC